MIGYVCRGEDRFILASSRLKWVWCYCFLFRWFRIWVLLEKNQVHWNDYLKNNWFLLQVYIIWIYNVNDLGRNCYWRYLKLCWYIFSWKNNLFLDICIVRVRSSIERVLRVMLILNLLVIIIFIFLKGCMWFLWYLCYWPCDIIFLGLWVRMDSLGWCCVCWIRVLEWVVFSYISWLIANHHRLYAICSITLENCTIIRHYKFLVFEV